jgi:hypothetical protein
MTLTISSKRGSKESTVATILDEIGDNTIHAGDFYVRRRRVSDGMKDGTTHMLGKPRRTQGEAQRQNPTIRLNAKNPGPIDLGDGLFAMYTAEAAASIPQPRRKRG